MARAISGRFETIAHDPQGAAASFEQLATDRSDPVAQVIAKRLRAAAAPSYA